ncbi:MAG: alkaline shock response membrane anchor protein AmaP [Moorellales bacterium]
MGMLARAIALLYTLVLAGLGMVVAAIAAGWQEPVWYWNGVMASPQERWIIGALAVVVALVGLWAAVGSVGSRGPDQILVHSTSVGEVFMSLAAVEHTVGRVARQVRGVQEVHPRVRAGPTGVAVTVEVAVQPEVSVPQVTGELQEKVRRQIEEMIGLQVLEVRVLVESVLRGRSRVR